MTEQQAMDRLNRYREMAARIKSLSSYSVGGGITVSRLNEDDQLQELHAKLRLMPSYMYLSKYEQTLEQTANAYLTSYPAGVKAQKRAIPYDGIDEEDEKLLEELREKVQKVIAARGYDVRDDIDDILNRLAKLQDLQTEINRIDTVLKALEMYKPDYAKLLRLRFVEGRKPDEAASELNIVRQTLYKWQREAVKEFSKLAS